MPAHMNINDSFRKKTDEARMRLALSKAMTDTCIELRDRLAMPPTPKITGNLRRSHSYEVRRSGDMIEGLIKNSANYWVYVNFGTSKRNGTNFVGQVMMKVKPAQKIKENFNKYYKT